MSESRYRKILALWMNFGQSDDLEEHPNEVWLRYSYNTEEAQSKVSLLKGGKNTPTSIHVFPMKYEHGHPIKPAKLAGLESMQPFLPPE